jgi:hypothetical protein
MKVTIKKNNEVHFLQRCEDNSDKLNKLVGHLTQLTKGDKDVVELECNGHTLTLSTESVDISVVAKLANGIIVKNPVEALVPKAAPAAETANVKTPVTVKP